MSPPLLVPIIIYIFIFVKSTHSFRLGDSIQVDRVWGSNIWRRRHLEVLVPASKKEAGDVVDEIFRKTGLPPVKYIINFLERRKTL